MTASAAPLQLSVAKSVVLLTGEEQHLFLSRQNNPSVCNPEIPGTSVFFASPCARGPGYYSYSTGGSSMVHPKDALAVLVPGPLKLPR